MMLSPLVSLSPCYAERKLIRSERQAEKQRAAGAGSPAADGTQPRTRTPPRTGALPPRLAALGRQMTQKLGAERKSLTSKGLAARTALSPEPTSLTKGINDSVVV